LKLAILYHGAFGEKVLAHLRDVPKFCAGCAECTECRRQYGLNYAGDVVLAWEVPGDLPLMLEDDPAQYLPPASSLEGVHTILAINLHPDLLLSLPELAQPAGVKALIVPLEDPQWLQGGARRQVEKKARQCGLEVVFPKPFCALREDPAYPEVARFIRHFRIGYPELVAKKVEGVIQEVRVLRSSPCGAAYFVARTLAGVPDDDKVPEFVGLKWHAYPCTSSMKMDRELKDTILHVAGELHRQAVASALGLAEDRQRTADPAAQALLAQELLAPTAYDRYLSQQPQCRYGDSGICCRICIQGPCQITAAAPRGVCGATAYTIVARNLLRSVVGGTAAHAGHAKHILLALQELGDGKAPNYRIADPGKLCQLAARFGLPTAGRDTGDILKELVRLGLEEYGRLHGGHLRWVEETVAPGRARTFRETGILPVSIFDTIAGAMSQTHLGMDADPVSLVFKTLEAALADFGAMHLGTDLSDVLFGVPVPVRSEANLGVMDAGKVNIAVHGHNPLVAEMMVEAARELEGTSRAAGATGIQLLGICCTGNEVLMRRGVPLATNFMSQELPIMTGALDAMVVDVQCIMPSVQECAGCFHTRIITTSPQARIPGAHHLDFTPENALEKAREVVGLAIAAYRARAGTPVSIPQVKHRVVAGFSLETLLRLFSGLAPGDPISVLTSALESKQLRGMVLFAGCNNLKATQDQGFLTMARILARHDVLLFATGCAAGAFAKLGLLSPAAVPLEAGDGLKAFLDALERANAAWLPDGLPLVFHLGSCVDTSRSVDLVTAVAAGLGVDTPYLPYAVSAPEAMSEKSLSIGSWNVAMGFPVHVGIVPPVLGSELVNSLLLRTARDIFGGHFIWETDPSQAAHQLLATLDERSRRLRLHRQLGRSVPAASGQ
jgi:carbon-monoxide dehydrogenase catalytic subunit